MCHSYWLDSVVLEGVIQLPEEKNNHKPHQTVSLINYSKDWLARHAY